MSNNKISEISDRYIDSSLVYQGFTRGLGIDKVRELNLWATDNYLPDAVFFLDLEPEIGLKRIADNEREVNRFDEETKTAFLDLYSKVDATVESPANTSFNQVNVE